MSKYSKALAAFGAFCGVVAAALADGTIDQSELAAIVVSAVGVVGVYQARNTSTEPQ